MTFVCWANYSICIWNQNKSNTAVNNNVFYNLDILLGIWVFTLKVTLKPLQHLNSPGVYGALIMGGFGRLSLWTPGQMASGRLRSRLHLNQAREDQGRLLDARHSWEVGPGVHQDKTSRLYTSNPPLVPVSRLLSGHFLLSLVTLIMTGRHGGIVII